MTVDELDHTQCHPTRELSNTRANSINPSIIGKRRLYRLSAWLKAIVIHHVVVGDLYCCIYALFKLTDLIPMVDTTWHNRTV